MKLKLLGILLAVVFCFSGCSWFDTTPPSGGGGNGGGDDTTNNITDDRLQNPDSHLPEVDYDEDYYNDVENESYAEITQGTRATYIPTKYDTSADAVLNADRAKFDENAGYQYEIVARVILHYLSGRYGQAGGNNATEILYEFYADTSLLPSGDATSKTISLPATKPIEKNSSLLHATDGAIEAQTTGLTGEYTQSIDSWVLERTTTNAYKWAFSLGSPTISGYNQTFIERFVPIIQINLMEYVLGLPQSSKSLIESTGADAMLENYVAKIQRLGIKQTQEFANFMYDYIMSVVIGENATSWDSRTMTYVEPSDTYETEIPDPNDPSTNILDTITVYYDMDGDPSTTTFLSQQLYKYDYSATVQDIVDLTAGTFDAEGNVVNPAIFADFPTYSRVEIADIDANAFYTEGEGDDVKKLASMAYHEYQSAIIYPDGIFNYDFSAEDGQDVDMTQKLWQFDLVDLYVDSKQDITLDVYIRLHIGGTNYFAHVTRMNTDSTKSFSYEAEASPSDFEAEVDFYFLEEKTNYTMIDMTLFFNEERMENLQTGIENKEEKTFYAGENSYKDTFAGKLGSSVSFGNDLKVTNHYGVTVDLNEYALCSDTGDFVEFIFAPVKDKGEDYDYSFKFMIKTIYFGSVEEE